MNDVLKGKLSIVTTSYKSSDYIDKFFEKIDALARALIPSQLLISRGIMAIIMLYMQAYLWLKEIISF